MHGSVGYPMHGSLERTMNGGSYALWIGWLSPPDMGGLKAPKGQSKATQMGECAMLCMSVSKELV